MRLHYALARLTIEEWLRPLPPPTARRTHDPKRVARLVGHLFTHPSLASFAALPQLYFEEGFGGGGEHKLIANVTRALFTYGGPRFGAPNLKDDALAIEHMDDFSDWWCGGQPTPKKLKNQK